MHRLFSLLIRFQILCLFFIIFLFYLTHLIHKKIQINSLNNFYKEEAASAKLIFNKRSVKATNLLTESYGDPIRVLVIEGGGLRGLFALKALQYLEEKTGKPISKLFDVMGGSSIGGLICSALSVPGVDGAKYKASDLNALILDSSNVLNNNRMNKIFSLKGLLSPRILNIDYIKNLQLVYGDTLLSDSINHLILAGFNMDNMETTLFHSRGPLLLTTNPLLYQLIGGTTSPFGFMPPNKILLNSSEEPAHICDAAMFLNNPTLSIILDLKKMYPEKKILLVYISFRAFRKVPLIKPPFFSGYIDFARWFIPIYIDEYAIAITSYVQHLAKYKEFGITDFYEIGRNSLPRQSLKTRSPLLFTPTNIASYESASNTLLEGDLSLLDQIIKKLQEPYQPSSM